MATRYLPIIQSGDYETFRRMLGRDIPDTYDEWCNLMANRSLQVTRGGHTARGIEIHPDEFSVWLTAPGRERTFHSLEGLAFVKGSTLDRD